MKIILAFEDPELTGFEKQIAMVKLLYKEIPEDFKEAVARGMQFMDGGKYGEKSKEPGLRLCSFEKDAELIYAAFRQTHGIDLSATEPLHWWKFMALFDDLGANTAFCNLVNLRRRVKTGKASKEEIQLSKEMGDAFDLPEPDRRTPEEKEAEFRFFQMIKAQ